MRGGHVVGLQQFDPAPRVRPDHPEPASGAGSRAPHPHQAEVARGAESHPPVRARWRRHQRHPDLRPERRGCTVARVRGSGLQRRRGHLQRTYCTRGPLPRTRPVLLRGMSEEQRTVADPGLRSGRFPGRRTVWMRRHRMLGNHRIQEQLGPVAEPGDRRMGRIPVPLQGRARVLGAVQRPLRRRPRRNVSLPRHGDLAVHRRLLLRRSDQRRPNSAGPPDLIAREAPARTRCGPSYERGTGRESSGRAWNRTREARRGPGPERRSRDADELRLGRWGTRCVLSRSEPGARGRAASRPARQEAAAAGSGRQVWPSAVETRQGVARHGLRPTLRRFGNPAGT